jgi:hypothetical protein
MIISAHKESEYYNPECFDYEVYLDGVKQYRCYLANDEEGYIERYVVDSNNQLVLSKDKKEIETERVYGKVSVAKIK